MIAENTTALKLCPFCGAVPEIEDDVYFDIACSNTECCIGLNRYETKELAIQAWNNRPLDDVVDKQNFLYKEAIGICDTALNEVRHAQEQGKNWYTRGEQGMYEQVRVWVDRGLKAIQRVRAQS